MSQLVSNPVLPFVKQVWNLAREERPETRGGKSSFTTFIPQIKFCAAPWLAQNQWQAPARKAARKPSPRFAAG